MHTCPRSLLDEVSILSMVRQVPHLPSYAGFTAENSIGQYSVRSDGPPPTLPLPPDTLARVGTWWVGEGLGTVLVPQAILESKNKSRKEHRAHTPAGPMHVAPIVLHLLVSLCPVGPSISSLQTKTRGTREGGVGDRSIFLGLP